MTWMQILTIVAASIAKLLYEVLSGQIKTKDDLGQGLARAAVDAGIEADDMARHVTDAGAARTEEAVALAGAALYPPKDGS